MVELTVKEYRDLVEAQAKLNILINTLYRNATINYSKNGLNYNDKSTDNILDAVDPFRYDRALKAAIDAEERRAKKEAENG